MYAPLDPSRRKNRLRQALAVFIAVAALGNTADLHSRGPSNSEGLELFEKHIRPVLVGECLECHGSEKQKGGLRLDSRPGWEKGGDSGAPVVPGHPEKSLLLRTIRHEEPDLKMPEKRPKLDAAVASHFERWIALGAPDPRDAPAPRDSRGLPWAEVLAARRSWWSLQPVRTSAPPGPEAHPVDAFLGAALQRQSIEPAPAAAPEALVRRLHFVLTGLPPSPEEVRLFCEKERVSGRPAAVRERAAELAASPAYGEHWARHWTDLVRYAESHGSEGDPELPNAHHYRDYLIRAFAADVPVNQLILEHLAGDQLAQPRISPEGIVESRIGPAHLRMVEHGYRPVDTLDEHMKVLDNQIDVVFKAFQALTLSCARCHDHKFDAVSQRDYTALRGIFESIRPAQILASSAETSGAARKPEFRTLKEDLRTALARVWDEEADEFPARLRKLASPPKADGLEAVRRELSEIEKEIALRMWKRMGLAGTQPPVLPYALWTFEDGPQDLLGRVSTELLGGAAVHSGALHLDGKKAYLRSAPLADTLRERTFETWASPASLAQRGGGVIGLERTVGHGFDALVFGEKTPKKWVPGSEYFRRTLQPEGTDETDTAAPIHLALVYREDDSIEVFRNGTPYGKPYRKDSLQSYPAGESRVLMGLRHTGANTGFFEGRIEEARLYNRALTASEIASSFRAGPTRPGASSTARPNSDEDAALERLRKKSEELRTQFAQLQTQREQEDKNRRADSEEHVLFAAFRAAHSKTSADFEDFLGQYLPRTRARTEENRKWNASTFPQIIDLGAENGPCWFSEGPDVEKIRCGDFRVRLRGTSVFDALLPAGMGGSLLLPHTGGILTSPEFTLQHSAIHVRFFSRNGCSVRLIPDSYPLGTVGAPTAALQRSTPEWTRLNAAYRVGASVYLECATPDHLPNGGGGPPKGTSTGEAAEGPHFLIEKIAWGAGTGDGPRPELGGLENVLEGATVAGPEDFLRHVAGRLQLAVKAWRENTLSESQRELLQACLERQILSTDSGVSPAVTAALDAYRKAAARLVKPVSVPGVIEHAGRDAALLPRGDHKKPGQTVPRGFLEVFHTAPFSTAGSGRMELAHLLVDPKNPLTARVMVNRLWHWVFGAGIVATVDDFGRMGEQPAHPELLDFLAHRFLEDGWSARRMLLWLVETEAFQRASTPTPSAQEKDPSNALLSHAFVRRLEAEEIRDAMLEVSGQLQRSLFGAPVAESSPRRSLYVRHRRAGLSPLFAAFDAPRPFTTQGRRSVTTVPAQSLLLLNDPSILKLAEIWAQRTSPAPDSTEVRIQRMFEAAFGRGASPSEIAGACALAAQNGLPAVAHALFNAKEFIYLR